MKNSNAPKRGKHSEKIPWVQIHGGSSPGGGLEGGPWDQSKPTIIATPE